MNFRTRLEKIFFKQRSDSQKTDALLFLLLFAVFFAAFYVLLNFFTGTLLHYYAAGAGAFFLKLLGISADVVPNADGFPHLVGTVRGNAFDAQINTLCAGAMELAVVFAIVLASRDKKLKTRLLGMLGAVIVFSIFNPLRIALTLNAVGSWTLPLLHDLLFRISLVLIIVGYYAAWYYSTPSAPHAGARAAARF